jgi:uncharacterized protein YkwD
MHIRIDISAKRHTSHTITLAAVLSCTFLAACGGDEIDPSQAGTPSPAVSAPAPAVTPTPQATPTASPLPTVTPTPAPTSTPTAVPTSTPTSTPTASPSPTSTPTAVPAPSAGLPAEKVCSQANFQADILAAVNAARSSGYVCASGNKSAAALLAWNNTLFEVAAAHSQDMATQLKDLSHTGSDGSNIGQRVTRAGYSWSRVGENIAVNYANANTVVDGWLKSSTGHCENIMDPRFTQLAVACVNGAWNNISNAPYYTMVLTAPR